jgi:type IVB pilus formation R64 PilN family outer membrane protein
MKRTILLAPLLAASCASLETMKADQKNMTSVAQEKMSATMANTANRTAHFSDTAFIASPKDAIRYVDPLPAIFGKTISVTDDGKPKSLPEIAERINQQFAVPVRLMLDAPMTQTANSVQTTNTATVGGLPPAPPGIPPNSLPSPISGTNTMLSSVSAAIPEIAPISINYDGSLSGLLDRITTKNNLSWRYKNGAIEIYRYITKTFKVHSIPGLTGLAASIERGGGSGTANGGSSQTGGMSVGGMTTVTGSTGGNSIAQSSTVDIKELSHWKDLSDSIKIMLGPKGSVVVSQSMGIVTVTDTPDRVARIEQHIEETNRIATQQVVIHYQVLAVDKTDFTRFGVNLSAAFNALNKNYGFALSSMALPQAAAGSAILSAFIPNTATGTMGQFSGSQLLIDALETQGHVSQVTSGTINTLNNKPAPIQNVDEKSYIASVQALQTANVGSSTGVQQSKVVTGFSMNLLPHILEDDRVLMQWSMNLSTLVALVEKEVGTTTVQSPEIRTRELMDQVSMRAGETLILSGFETTNASLSKTGSLIQGGGESVTEDKAILVILITPVLTAG